MAVKIRLQRKGRTKAPFYHIVIADSRFPRDGRFIEKIGTYNPLTVPATIELNRDVAYDWLMRGAQPTDTVNAILRFKGVLYKKHLMEGVKKGALSLEQAEAKLTEWIGKKEGAIEQRKAEVARRKHEMAIKVDGTPKAKPVIVEPEPIAEDTQAVEETVTNVEENAAPAEDSAVEA